MRTPEIKTNRLILTPLVPSDAKDLFDYRSDPEVCRYQSWSPASLAEVRQFIQKLQPVAFDTPGTWFQFGIRLNDSRVLAGDLGVHFPAQDTRQAEIGFTLAPAYQGRGMATEAVGGMLGHLFGSLGKHRVYASVDPANAASIKLLLRLGMRAEAHFRQSLWLKGRWVDDAVFAILETEWKNPAARHGERASNNYS